MQIKIITLHAIYNPGSVFQAFGLQEFLRDKGFEVKIIDYRPTYSTIGRNKIKGIFRKVLFYKNEASLREKYGAFIENKLFLTEKKYKTLRELKSELPEAEVYISGSDQLWNLDYDCGNDDAYYLTFIKKREKISYATSIGKKNLSAEELKTICGKICDFKMLSVREKSSSEILSRELGKKVFWVCDPVFLLSTKVYEEMTTRIMKEKYAVIYLSAESVLLNQVVADIKERTDYKIILLGGNRRRCQCDMHVKDLGPYDFLSLIRYSEIVISSSFHATAFSHIFKKKFGVILPKANGERIQSLLNLSGLSNHIVENKKDVSRIYENIDYVSVDRRMKEFIEQSKKILLQALCKD